MTFAKAVTPGYIPMGGVVVGGRVRAALEADPDLARPIGDDTIALCPPLVITDAEVDRVLDATAQALGT